MQINRNMILPPVNGKEQAQAQAPQQAVQNPAVLNQPETMSFRQVMENTAQTKELHFSKHANMRLLARDIQLDPKQLERLEDGVAKAQGKGIRDSLVLIDNIALVVNITNKVVITALSQQDQVFTNIDGAVIV